MERREPKQRSAALRPELRDQIVLGENAVNKARQELGLEPLDEVSSLTQPARRMV